MPRLPPKNKREIGEHAQIAPAIVAVIVMISVSRFLDMGELMGEDARQLLVAEDAQQPGGRRDGGVGGIAAGGEGVRLRLVDDIDLRHRQLGPVRQLLDEADEFRCRAGVDPRRAVHAQDELVGVPVGEKVVPRGEDEGDDHARPAAEQKTDARKSAVSAASRRAVRTRPMQRSSLSREIRSGLSPPYCSSSGCSLPQG